METIDRRLAGHLTGDGIENGTSVVRVTLLSSPISVDHGAFWPWTWSSWIDNVPIDRGEQDQAGRT